MGSYLSMYLGTAKATQPAHAQKRRSPWFSWTGLASGICLPMGRDGRPILCYRRRRQDHELWFRSRRPLPAALRNWKYCPVRGSSVPQGWRRLPSGPPLRTSSGLGFSGHGNGFTMGSPWNARLSCHTQSLVDIRTAPVESLSNLSTCPSSQESPDPCAKETALRALSRCEEGQRRLDRPLRSESPEPRLSAFRPVMRNGVVPVFVPRPGPLRRSICSGCKRLQEEDTEPRPDSSPACRPPCCEAPHPHPPRAQSQSLAAEMGADQHSRAWASCSLTYPLSPESQGHLLLTLKPTFLLPS